MASDFLQIIYIDGSCPDNNNTDSSTIAGWSFVVIVGDKQIGKGAGDVFFEDSGIVLTDSLSPNYLGAKVGSNNTGELSAMAHALRWLLVEGGNEDVLIRTDSIYAGNQTDGSWKAKANVELVLRVRNLWKEVSELRNVKWEHVKAHSGHRWNERADHLAYRAATNRKPVPLSFWKPGQR